MAAGGRVSIPPGARRTVADIKEIAGGHTDDEVYAMLRECNMDPNETAQRLLLQDTFHEVKRKRDKKKESGKNPLDSRWRPAMQGRGGKSGRRNYYSCSLSNYNDSAGRSAFSGKENGCDSSWSINMNVDMKASTSMPSNSLSSGLSNGPSPPADPSAVVAMDSCDVGSMIKSGSTAFADQKDNLQSKGVVTAVGPNALDSLKPASSSGPVASSHILCDAGASGQAIGSMKTSVEDKLGREVPADSKGSCQQSVASSFGRSSGSRPSSSYSSRSQHSCGSQIVIPNKEWKPKPTSTTGSQAMENIFIPDDVTLTADTIRQSAPISNSVSKEDLLKVDKSFNNMRFPDKQHVIIPDYLQVSESEKIGLNFGSFTSSIQQTVVSADPECAKSSSQFEYDSYQELKGIDDDPQSMQSSKSAGQEHGILDSAEMNSHKDQNSSSTREIVPVLEQLPYANLENCSPSAIEAFSVAPTESEKLGHNAASSRAPQSTAFYTSSFLTYGLVPQPQGNQIVVVEKSESEAQQPIDLSVSYHTQTYQPTTDADEQLSPLLAADAAHSYGNIPVLPAQTSHYQEGNTSPVLASSISASVTTPAAAAIPTSVPIPPQTLPVFCQSLGVHLHHFPTNYVPYNRYISPFFVPAPTFHPFLGSATFPQPRSSGGVYPTSGSAGILPSVKYSVSSFKPGANTGSQATISIPGGYGTYGSSPSIYTNNTTVSSVSPAENDDLTSTQFKENSIYIAGHQTEGSALWVPTPGRDVSALQANAFYGLPPQGQQVSFAPQGGHGTYGGIYHPTQTVAGAAVHPLLQASHTMAGTVEIIGAPGSVYQQPQAQINWGSY